jgi:hypothetical protein
MAARTFRVVVDDTMPGRWAVWSDHHGEPIATGLTLAGATAEVEALTIESEHGPDCADDCEAVALAPEPVEHDAVCICRPSCRSAIGWGVDAHSPWCECSCSMTAGERAADGQYPEPPAFVQPSAEPSSSVFECDGCGAVLHGMRAYNAHKRAEDVMWPGDPWPVESHWPHDQDGLYRCCDVAADTGRHPAIEAILVDSEPVPDDEDPDAGAGAAWIAVRAHVEPRYPTTGALAAFRRSQRLYHPSDSASRATDHERQHGIGARGYLAGASAAFVRRNAAAMRERAYRRHLDEQDGERVPFWPRPIAGLGAWGEELAVGTPTGILRGTFGIALPEWERAMRAIRRYEASR